MKSMSSIQTISTPQHGLCWLQRLVPSIPALRLSKNSAKSWHAGDRVLDKICLRSKCKDDPRVIHFSPVPSWLREKRDMNQGSHHGWLPILGNLACLSNYDN